MAPPLPEPELPLELELLLLLPLLDPEPLLDELLPVPPDEASDSPPLELLPELDPLAVPELLPPGASGGPEGVEEHPATPAATNAENARKPVFVMPCMVNASLRLLRWESAGPRKASVAPRGAPPE